MFQDASYISQTLLVSLLPFYRRLPSLLFVSQVFSSHKVPFELINMIGKGLTKRLICYFLRISLLIDHKHLHGHLALWKVRGHVPELGWEGCKFIYHYEGEKETGCALTYLSSTLRSPPIFIAPGVTRRSLSMTSTPQSVWTLPSNSFGTSIWSSSLMLTTGSCKGSLETLRYCTNMNARRIKDE